MMAVQEFLNKRKLDDLAEDLAIQITRHDTLPLAILNYHQINSPKYNPVARECRGLVVNTLTQRVVARSFPRFFNWGEDPEGMAKFDWDDFRCETKHDGSLAVLFHWGDRWHANTRGSFGYGNMQGHDLTWHDGICKALKIESLDELSGALDQDLTYVCEFCSPWNKIVRLYEEPELHLLTLFRGEDELPPEEVHETLFLGIFKREYPFNVRTIEDVKEGVRHHEENNPTFEGFVIRDRNNLRFKIKTATYLGFHRAWANGGLCRDEDLLDFVLRNDGDELLATFPEVRESYLELDRRVSALWGSTCAEWVRSRHSETKKEFALKVKDHPMSGALFRCWDGDRSLMALSKAFRESPERILKAIGSEKHQHAN